MSFGCNASGQLGTGPSLTATAGRAPALVASLGDERVVSVAAGASHSLVATDGGAVFAFGSRKDGVLGKDEKRSFLTGFLPGAAVRAMGAAPPQHYPAQVPGTGTRERARACARARARRRDCARSRARGRSATHKGSHTHAPPRTRRARRHWRGMLLCRARRCGPPPLGGAHRPRRGVHVGAWSRLSARTRRPREHFSSAALARR